MFVNTRKNLLIVNAKGPYGLGCGCKSSGWILYNLNFKIRWYRSGTDAGIWLKIIQISRNRVIAICLNYVENLQRYFKY